jgi:S1-C subfamily serine protease
MFGRTAIRNGCRIIVAGAVAALSLPALSEEVCRWVDKQGNVTFADCPKDDSSTERVEVEPHSGTKRVVAEPHLTEQLEATEKPHTPIEKAALAVVKISTPTGNGSGFFISSEGHIVTNRHVVRIPPWWVAEREAFIAELDAAFREDQRIFNIKRGKLRQAEKQLKEIESFIRDVKDPNQAEYAEGVLEQRSQKLASARQEYRKAKRAFDKARREWETAKSDFRIATSLGSLATSFDITLKNKAVIQATLVKLSEEHDLALLKVDGYVTPFLRPADSATVHAGMSAYVMGNPVDLHDFVTSGTVSQVNDEEVWTDATTLPGHSGGPLVTGAGTVIGVITYRAEEMVTGSREGFGVAQPFSVVEESFAEIFQAQSPNQ